MRLQTRISITNVVILTLLIILISFISYRIIFNSFLGLEDELIEKDIERTKETILKDIEALGLIAIDWGHWDDTYNFVLGKYEGYREETLGEETLENIGVSFVIYGGPNDEIFAEAYSETLEEGLISEIKKAIKINSLFTNKKYQEGVLVINDTVFLIASSDILTSNEDSETVGTLTFARMINEERERAFSDILKHPLKIFAYTSKEKTERQLMLNKTHIVKTPTFVEAYTTLEGLNEESKTIVEIILEREVYLRGKATLNILILSLILFGIAYLFLTILFNMSISRRITDPLKKLSNAARDIGAGKDVGKIEVTSEKEIQELAESIENMRAQLSHSKSKIVKTNKELEKKVAKRTEDLEDKNEALERANKLMLGREMEMVKLKDKLKKKKHKKTDGQ